MPIERHKSEFFGMWKAQAWEALFWAYYGIRMRFRIGRGQFECASDFQSCMDVNREIISLLPHRPQVCVIGDSVGGTVITSLAQLVPGHVCVVARQDVLTFAILWDNIVSFFRVMAVYFDGAVNVFRSWRIGTESSSLDEYDSVNAKRALLQDYVVSLHNRYPWEFIQGLRCSRSREPVLSHFHLLIYQPIWNRGHQVKMLDIQREMGLDTRKNNFERPLDVDLVNDLALADHEASHEETFRNMDEFIMKPMEAVGTTVDVIVVTVRGSVSADTWESLRAGGCLLAMTYAITKQMEQFPNERDSRLVFNPDTGELDRLPDVSDRPSHARIREKKDANGGRLGQIFAVILQRRGTGGRDAKSECLPYKREWWYGEYMHVRDADKQAMYVLKTSHEVPCRRISAKGTKLTVVMERQLKGRRRSASQYTMVPARERKIEVQIEDLTFMLHELTVYEAALDSGETIVLDEHYRIMQDIAQAEYSYKYIDSVVSQSNRHDSASQKAYGQHLIDAKIALFHEVHAVMHRIRHRNGWRLPVVVKRPSAYEEVPREDLVNFKQNQREFIKRPGAASRLPLGSLLPQLIDLATPMTLGDHNQCEDSVYWDGGDSSVGYSDIEEEHGQGGGGLPRPEEVENKWGRIQDREDGKGRASTDRIQDREFHGNVRRVGFHGRNQRGNAEADKDRSGLLPRGTGPPAPAPVKPENRPKADVSQEDANEGFEGVVGRRAQSNGQIAKDNKRFDAKRFRENEQSQAAFEQRYLARERAAREEAERIAYEEQRAGSESSAWDLPDGVLEEDEIVVENGVHKTVRKTRQQTVEETRLQDEELKRNAKEAYEIYRAQKEAEYVAAKEEAIRQAEFENETRRKRVEEEAAARQKEWEKEENRDARKLKASRLQYEKAEAARNNNTSGIDFSDEDEDMFANPLPEQNKNGEPLPEQDENGEPLPEQDENGEPLPEQDENGEQEDDDGSEQKVDEFIQNIPGRGLRSEPKIGRGERPVGPPRPNRM